MTAADLEDFLIYAKIVPEVESSNKHEGNKYSTLKDVHTSSRKKEQWHLDIC